MNSLCPAPLPFPGPRILCGPLPLPPPPVQESPRLPFLFLGKGQVASQGEGPCVASHFPKARSSASMGFPEPQSGWQRVCSSGRLALALLGFIGLISLLTVVFGITGHMAGKDLKKMEEMLQKVNRSISTEMLALKQKETDDLKKLAKFNKAVEHLTDEMGKVKSEVQGKVGNLRNTLNTMNCNVEDIKHNRTVSRAPCCPAGWDSFASHCYWVSRAEKSWDEAKADCEDKDAHLVTITSYLEQRLENRTPLPLLPRSKQCGDLCPPPPGRAMERGSLHAPIQLGVRDGTQGLSTAEARTGQAAGRRAGKGEGLTGV
ncbi:asialoglycoprotein receptor 1-like isoform X2 [Sphaerodactylus townsendi]|uniref:asialoglycoprotein receptor 1-like isoform X2 n=1 Tax=Sphaerodactylus townsendi TaxID=933632 RepID=UPI002025FDE8|nr:asialoglycoprotein receptor 1-like isoform X2 [Sphaerodactylus townsendi]